MHCDLHLHTTASDGHLTAEELVAEALRAGLDAIAVTDHDSVVSVLPAVRAAAGTGLTVIPGVEFSAVHDGRDIHILGYFVDPTDPDLAARLSDLRAARAGRAAAIVEALATAGFHLTLDDVLALAEGGSVGRSHIARALVARGHATDAGEAFERLIGRGRPFYVSKPATDPADVVAYLAGSGAVAVIAHPGVSEADDLIPALVDAGLRGIEAYHAEHTPSEAARYASIAADLGLIVTGGSDFHGSSAPGAGIGEVVLPEGTCERLLAQAGPRPARTQS